MFGKIFEQIYDSSVAEDLMLRVVFQDFIVLADIDGVVDRTHEAISRRTNVPIEEVRRCISVLENPDPKSRCSQYEGRRIIRLDEHRDWGWFIVNYERFRLTASAEQRREKTRDRMRKLRGNSVCDATVTPGDACDAMQKQKQRHKYIDRNHLRFAKPTIEEIKLQAAKVGLPSVEAERFYNHYESNGWKVGRNPMKSWEHALVNWRGNYQNQQFNHAKSIRVNRRNEHTCENVTDYGEAAKRKMERQALEAQNRQSSEAHGT